MTIEIADRLIKLRKQNGLSQEELADKLGISRQAVSKWERAEASPDTDNLICLAKLYGVSLDELLNTDETVEDIAKEQKDRAEEKKEEKDDHVVIDSEGIHLNAKNGESVAIDENFRPGHINEDKLRPEEIKRRRFLNNMSGIAGGVLALGITITYILLITIAQSREFWARTFWLYYLLLPICWSIFSMIKYRKLSHFAYPILVTMVFLGIGLYANIWHPTWVVFLTIPIFYIIFNRVDAYTRPRRIQKAYIEGYIDAEEDDD